MESNIKEDSMLIYKITCRENGKSYIGKTTRTLDERWAFHVYEAFRRPGVKTNPFHCAIRKYGIMAFNIDVLEICETEEALAKCEVDMILKHATIAPSGYNLKIGNKHNEATKRKLSEHPSAHSEENIARLRKQAGEARHGPHTEETKALMSKIAKEKGRKPLNTPEVNRRKADGHFKKVVDQNGRVYNSVKEAAEVNGLHRANVSTVLKGKAKSTKGFVFTYLK